MSKFISLANNRNQHIDFELSGNPGRWADLKITRSQKESFTINRIDRGEFNKAINMVVKAQPTEMFTVNVDGGSKIILRHCCQDQEHPDLDAVLIELPLRDLPSIMFWTEKFEAALAEHKKADKVANGKR